MKLTVFFDEGMKYWVGVLEQEENSRLKVSRHIFGSEPKDAEVMYFVQKIMMPLIERATQTSEGGHRRLNRGNPKRLARQAAKELAQRGVSTRAQEAIKLEMECRKKQRKEFSRQQLEEEKERKYQLRIQKAKLKRRGR
ncbi:DUF2992 domain-containing protein [Paenibacillus sambharensis]|uniref:DUF2992 domain-containing protein n=1 Tax=Paenibacillus sambharensis TaxID=1803190 RepID=A0A2W1LCG5_9BACL|nr:YjdF family protein [Paenibacillus sambharensis]PZD96563.1 DUF2992 domain-containing protein [Paenibacillus sambharensis]